MLLPLDWKSKTVSIEKFSSVLIVFAYWNVSKLYRISSKTFFCFSDITWPVFSIKPFFIIFHPSRLLLGLFFDYIVAELVVKRKKTFIFVSELPFMSYIPFRFQDRFYNWVIDKVCIFPDQKLCLIPISIEFYSIFDQ